MISGDSGYNRLRGQSDIKGSFGDTY